MVRLTHSEPHDHVHQTREEHQKRNLIDAVHHTQIHVVFLLFFEEVERIGVVEDFLEEHCFGV